ncbi:MAG: hypothetical protein QOH57_3476 [Mycobacterium sp.]|nr:hypothetical protein [Mycobacterium sp.]
MKFTRNGLVKLVGAAISVAGLGLAIPGSVAADETGDAFIRKAAADGVNFTSRDAVILRAHSVCGLFAAGLAPDQVYANMLQNYASFSPRQNAIFMADAVQAYCPRYASLFIS